MDRRSQIRTDKTTWEWNIGYVAGAVTVSLKIDDQTAEDAFQRANITELVITPEGNFHAYNVKFASQFERAEG